MYVNRNPTTVEQLLNSKDIDKNFICTSVKQSSFRRNFPVWTLQKNKNDIQVKSNAIKIQSLL